ncbi:MAG: cytochrome c biogenesis protein CcdA [bacterium]
MGVERVVTALLLGMVASVSPCTLPLYPGFLAYLGARAPDPSRRLPMPLLGAAVLLGVLTTMLVLGLVIASLRVAVGSVLRIAVPLADLLLIIMGGLLLLNRNVFMRIPQLSVPVFGHPLLGAYAYGLIYGPITLPCSATLVVGVFALSFTTAQFASNLVFFALFGVGFGLPLLILSLLGQSRQSGLSHLLAARSLLFNRVSGLILIAVGIYDLRLNWPFLRLYFG